MKKQSHHYTTATAFRVALEARLKSISTNEGTDLQRLRRQVSFDRLLARIFAEHQTPWLLKGGYAMELRLKTARTTKDIDLSLPAQAASELKGQILKALQIRAQTDLSDFFNLVIGEPKMDLDAAPEGGARYPVTVSLAGKPFVKFHLDVGIGDAVVLPTEVIEARDWLGFAGIPAPKFNAISKEQQFAEKLHAYTLPRGDRFNSRVKDVIDMALLIQMGTMSKRTLKEAIQTTFVKRGTHELPKVFPSTPPEWESPYQALAKECCLELTLQETRQTIEKFIS